MPIWCCGTRAQRRQFPRRRKSRRATSTSSKAASFAATPRTPVSQGKLVWADGDLRAVQGAGRYIKRLPFGPNFDATAKRVKEQTATPVERPDEVIPLAKAA